MHICKGLLDKVQEIVKYAKGENVFDASKFQTKLRITDE